MGEPVRKASGRTFHPMSTLVSDTCRSSPQVESSHSFKTSNQPPSEALKSGLSMAVYATVRFILNLNLSLNLIICILAILKGFPQNVNPSTPRNKCRGLLSPSMSLRTEP
jgi:hypothetical protein